MKNHFLIIEVALFNISSGGKTPPVAVFHSKTAADRDEQRQFDFDYFCPFDSNNGLTGLFSWIRLMASPIKAPTLI